MAAVFKYSALVLYAAATSFACFVVFTSSAGNYDASTEGLLPLLQIGTEALYFIIVISVYTIARMHGRDNLKTFYFITRSFGLRFFRLPEFYHFRRHGRNSFRFTDGIVHPFVFFFPPESEGALLHNACFAVSDCSNIFRKRQHNTSACTFAYYSAADGD